MIQTFKTRVAAGLFAASFAFAAQAADVTGPAASFIYPLMS